MKKMKTVSNDYNEIAQAKTVIKFVRVLREVYNGDYKQMLTEIEQRAVAEEDYETAGQMVHIIKKMEALGHGKED